ncbi:MAG TPA: hypothetical protein PKD72_08395, partial [Gemmatales bacterium]|nr:hypothetical protein [Gemmatales bacterium]
MSQTPTDKRWFTWGQFAFGLIVAAITFGIMLLRQNIADRKEEAKQTVFQLAPIQEDTIDP